MTHPENALYRGEVVHKRLRPVLHELRYRVATIFVDVDGLPALSGGLRLLGYNRSCLFSIRDRDFGPGDGTSIRDHVRAHVRKAGLETEVRTVFMLCYPRLLGYVFNPLTAYYCFDAAGRVRMMIYEVSNTFGERVVYALPGGCDTAQSCCKAMHVSPFNRIEGRYGFHLSHPGETLALGITLTTAEGPLMKAYFTGRREPMTDAALARVALAMPLMTLKVIAAIHWEALKLRLKGVPFVRRPRSRTAPAPLPGSKS